MTKHLRKLIMNRSRSKNTYLKNRTAGNWENFRVLRNKCTKESIKVKKEYFRNINIKLISDNKTFWKTDAVAQWLRVSNIFRQLC